MLKCYGCGNVIDDDLQKSWTEPSGEPIVGCPRCFCAMDEAVQCSCCDGYFFAEELNSGLCDKCILEKAQDIDLCYEIGSESKQSIDLNYFLLFMFDAEDIEQILFRELKQATPDFVNIEEFVNNDKSWFAEHLKRREA